MVSVRAYIKMIIPEEQHLYKIFGRVLFWTENFRAELFSFQAKGKQNATHYEIEIF